MSNELAGDVQQAVTQPLRLGVGELAGEADELHPGEEVLGDQRELQPCLVLEEGVVREIAHAGVLAGSDRVLDASAAAVTELQDGDVAAVLVGEEAGVPVAMFIEDLELRAGMRPLAADDQPGALRPGREIDAVRELGHPCAVTVLSVGVDRLLPLVFRDFEDRGADGVGQLVADREPDTGLAAAGGERVGAPADIGADQHLAAEVSGSPVSSSQHPSG